jgi:hypothetical protein
VERIDYAIAAIAVVLCGVGTWLGDTAAERFIAVVAVLSLAAAAMAVNRAVLRQPSLVVDYRNPAVDGRPVVWLRSGGDGPTIEVVVRNEGRGVAEAVEVRFDRLGASDIFNESGNLATAVDVTVYPPRFLAIGRVLNPGQEWVIARLAWLRGTAQPTTTGSWEASARGVQSITGVVELTMLDQPPTAP